MKFDIRTALSAMGQLYSAEQAGHRAGLEQKQQDDETRFKNALSAAQFAQNQQQQQQEQHRQARNDLTHIPGFVPTPEFGQWMAGQVQQDLNQPAPDFSSVANSIDPRNKNLAPFRAALLGTKPPGPGMTLGPVQGSGPGAYQAVLPGGSPSQSPAGGPPLRFAAPGEQDQYDQLISAYEKQAASPNQYDDAARLQAGQISAAARQAKNQGVPFAQFAQSRPDLGPSGLGALKPVSVNKDRKGRVSKGVEGVTKAIGSRLSSPEARQGWTDFIIRNPKPTDLESESGLDYAERWQSAAESFLNSVAGPAEERSSDLQKKALLGQWNSTLTNLQKPGLKADDYLRAGKTLAGLKPALEKAYPEMVFDLPAGLDPTPQMRDQTRQIQTSPAPLGPQGPPTGDQFIQDALPDTQTKTSPVPETDTEVQTRMLQAAADRATDPKEKARLLRESFGKMIGLVKSAEFKSMDAAGRDGVLASLNDTAEKLGLEKLPAHIDVGLTPNEQSLNKDREFKRLMSLRKQREAERKTSVSEDLAYNRDDRSQEQWEAKQLKASTAGPDKWDDQKKALVKEAVSRRNAARADVKRLEAIPEYMRGVTDKDWAGHHSGATSKLNEAQGAIDDLIGKPPSAAGPVQVQPTPAAAAPAGPATRSPADIRAFVQNEFQRANDLRKKAKQPPLTDAERNNIARYYRSHFAGGAR